MKTIALGLTCLGMKDEILSNYQRETYFLQKLAVLSPLLKISGCSF